MKLRLKPVVCEDISDTSITSIWGSVSKGDDFKSPNPSPRSKRVAIRPKDPPVKNCRHFKLDILSPN